MENMLANIPSTGQKRVVIAGAGFGGLKLARKLAGSDFQVVLLDRNNYHSFQPLFYQVAASGVEPGSIAFPLRKIFHGIKNIHFRVAAVKSVIPGKDTVRTCIGDLEYDFLVLATGAGNNFFGSESLARSSLPMKSLGESLELRNRLLENFEKALYTADREEQSRLLTVVIAGGGPTGVEIAGAIAEMKSFVLPWDYPELDFNLMKIILVEGTDRLLSSMSEISSKKSLKYLESLGVTVFLNRQVRDFDGATVSLGENGSLPANTLIWAAGIKGNVVDGLGEQAGARGGRVAVDEFNRVRGHRNVFAIGDLAFMNENGYPEGHPQVAQAAIQQAEHLLLNLKRLIKDRPLLPFRYRDRGSLATVGRNRAVVELAHLKFQGLPAWFFWMFIHLVAILGVKNRLFLFINWAWYYFTYDQSLRLIIRWSDDD